MPEARDPESIIAAAEQAANAGDLLGAERLLREAADVQEEIHGPSHHDLANTYNNLGVVYEMTGNLGEAEGSFRRALAIATAAFPAEHPVVATSRKNLEDFCALRGVPLEPPPTAPAAVKPAVEPAPQRPKPELSPPAAATPPPAREQPAIATTPPPVVTKQDAPPVVRNVGERRSEPTVDVEPSRERPTPLLSVGVAVAVVAVIVFALWYRGCSAPAPASTPRASAPVASAPAPTTAAAPTSATETARQPPERQPATPPAPKTAAPAPAPTKPAAKERAAKTAAATPTVLDASLCKTLTTGGRWRCDAPPAPAARGTLVFYTRVKSDTNTKVQHRWYQGARLRRSVDLTIVANPGSGYRTFSRYTVDSAGDWHVELRAADGSLLSEERFGVR